MNKKLNILLIISFAAVVFFVSAYVYFYNSLTESKTDVADFYNKSQEAKVKLENLKNTEKNFKRTVAEGDVISSLFLRPDSVVEFIQTIESLIKDTGISGSVDSVTEEKTPELERIGKEKINLVVSAHGSWSGMVNFLGLLERLPYKSTVNSFTLTNAKLDDTLVNGKKKVGAREWQLKVGMVVWADQKEVDDSSQSNQVDTNTGTTNNDANTGN